MNRLAHVAALVCLLLACDRLSLAQTIKSSYDRFKDETLVMTERLPLRSDCAQVRCDMVAAFVFKGQTPAPPDTIAFQFTFDSTSGDYAESRDLILIADDTRINFGRLLRSAEVKQLEIKLYEDVPARTITYVEETLTAKVPYDVLMKIAGAKEVQMKIGENVFPPLSDAALKAIDELASKIVPPPKPAANTPKPSQTAKPTQPARRPQRKGQE